MRIRSIKPEFWRSDDITGLAIEDRLLFIGLWSYVDDNGVGVDRLADVCADLFAHDLSVSPHDTLTRISEGLKRLHAGGLIERYSVGSKAYLHIRNWTKHQRINRPSPGRYPLPEQGSATPPPPLTEDSVSPHEDATPGAGEQRNRGTGEKNSSSATANAAPDPEPRPDVEALCQQLADRIEGNGSRKPTISKAWRDAARLLMDKDGYTREQVAWLINWSQDDEFWRTNILSMPKLREKFDQLKLRALSERQRVEAPSKRQQEIANWLNEPTSGATSNRQQEIAAWLGTPGGKELTR